MILLCIACFGKNRHPGNEWPIQLCGILDSRRKEKDLFGKLDELTQTSVNMSIQYLSNRLSALFFMGILYSCGTQTQDGQQPGERPNVILIITDDQGYGDLGYHGNPYVRTPTLDSLARVSTRLTNFYVSPVCAPTRSSLMTGSAPPLWV